MNHDLIKIQENIKYLRMLSQKYPTIQDAATRIINLTSYNALPKGTEHFMSDLHGESEAFIHILNNGSGVIREKSTTCSATPSPLRSVPTSQP